MIQAIDISKTYGETRALCPISIAFDAGTVTVLLGTSGCGKSTVLRILAGLIPSDTGHVTFDGETVSQKNIRQIRHRMGYVIQEGGLFPHLSVRDNVALLARELRKPTDWIDDRIDDLRRLTQLPDALMHRYPRQLSGGQRQRVSLMRALMLRPEVLLLDEPLGALDPIIRSELQDELKAIFAKLQATVICVTHDVREADLLADRIFLLRDGQIVQSGPMSALVQHPADEFVTRFLSAQGMATASVDGGHR